MQMRDYDEEYYGYWFENTPIGVYDYYEEPIEEGRGLGASSTPGSIYIRASLMSQYKNDYL